jgi:hypothetical protein
MNYAEQFERRVDDLERIVARLVDEMEQVAAVLNAVTQLDYAKPPV